MALTNEAQQLLSELDPAGRLANPASLMRKLGLDEQTFQAAAAELYEAGLAKPRGQRLARVVTATGTSPDAEMMLAALPADGSTIGGLRLRSLLDMDNETYTRTRNELDAAGLIVRGRGYGGTISRAKAKAESSAESRARLVAKESDLYEPFLDWIRAELEGRPGFARAKRTASPKGWSSSTGKWSRPDVTAVQVVTYEWLPQVTVEVLSYEIKRFADSQNLESVYETAAHQRWAHRASLVVEPDREAGALPDAMLDELRRFRLGLYVMRRRDDSDFEIREEIEPVRSDDPQPEDINDMIDTFLGRDIELRNEYRRWIGR